jgi:hypothetical protein
MVPIRCDHSGPICGHSLVDQIPVDFACKTEGVVERDIARGNSGRHSEKRGAKGREHLRHVSHECRVVETLPVQPRQKAAGIVGGIGIAKAIEIDQGHMPSIPEAMLRLQIPVDECGRSGVKEGQSLLQGRHQWFQWVGGCWPAFERLLTLWQNLLVKESLRHRCGLRSHLRLIELRQDRRNTCEQCGVAALYVRPYRLSLCPARD